MKLCVFCSFRLIKGQSRQKTCGDAKVLFLSDGFHLEAVYVSQVFDVFQVDHSQDMLKLPFYAFCYSFIFYKKEQQSQRVTQKKAHGQRAAVASAMLSVAYSHRLLKKGLQHVMQCTHPCVGGDEFISYMYISTKYFSTEKLHHEFNAHSGLEDYLQDVKSGSVVNTSISDDSCEMGFARFQ